MEIGKSPRRRITARQRSGKPTTVYSSPTLPYFYSRYSIFINTVPSIEAKRRIRRTDQQEPHPRLNNLYHLTQDTVFLIISGLCTVPQADWML